MRAGHVKISVSIMSPFDGTAADSGVASPNHGTSVAGLVGSRMRPCSRSCQPNTAAIRTKPR